MNDRAVSTALNYVLSLAIATILITGLIIGGGDFVEDRQEQVIRSELQVIGQQVAADVDRADRLLTAGDGTTEVSVSQSLPRELAGSSYHIELDPGSPGQVVLRSSSPEVTVGIRVETQSTLQSSVASGGTVVVTNAGGDLEVTNG